MKIFRYLKTLKKVADLEIDKNEFLKQKNIKLPKSTIDNFYTNKHINNFEDPVRIEKNVKIHNQLRIGKYTFIGANATFQANAISIGRFCSISQGCIVGTNHHPIDHFSTSAVFYSRSWGVSENSYKKKYNKGKSTIIGNDVWIGANAIVLGGVTVGDGAVIGAGSVVTKDVPPYAVVAGVPAKVLKYRFTESQIENFLKIKWWNNYEPNELTKYWEDRIEDFILNCENK